ncbi:hypothetical protein MKK75_11230 [Methylobacterium sp. J-030]|uniref:hypothetical protein n=1 Tax=Methylobacterium sp. J-030 TaxID=2836627 RepID=UPI001FB9B644|nr:hypothetical protein [Methylobacterium sp. J-030]MCJ2069360.1 hypothetical protein [Methylobacterium sp. J-030]
MPLSAFVPLTEAAAFTVGCAVLRTRWLDPDCISVVLVGAAALLVAGLLLALTPETVCVDANALDPAAIWPLAVGADPLCR